ALAHATDRQQLSDSLLGGVVPPAHSIISPSDPEYAAIEPSIVRYAYDPRRAAQMIEALGYSRGPDGILLDPTGQRLAVEIRTVTAETQQKLMLATVDFWRQVGVNAEPSTIPLQLAGAAEQYATFPGFLLVRSPGAVRGIRSLRSANSPLPENRFNGTNYGRHRSEEFDGLIDKLFVTVPMAQGMQALGQTVHYMTEQLNGI